MKKMKKIVFLILQFAVIFTACTVDPEWDSHFDEDNVGLEKSSLIQELESVNDISLFVEAIKKYELDTIFKNEKLYTVLAPNNDAFKMVSDEVIADPDQMKRMLLYHIFEGQTYYNDFSTGELTTLAGKLLNVKFDAQNAVVWGDGARALYSNQIMKSGVLHIVDKVSYPMMNLYEYIMSNPELQGLQNHIDNNMDEIFDRWESKIIAYTPLGEPIYDSIFVEKNRFLLYLPIDKDARKFTLFAPDNLAEMEQRIRDAATFYGPLPEGFFSQPVFDKLLFRGAYANEDFNNEMRSVTGKTVNVDHLLGAYGQKELSNGYFYFTKNYDVSIDSVFKTKELGHKEVWNSAYKLGNLKTFTYYSSSMLWADYAFDSEANDVALGAIGTEIPETSPVYNRSVVVNIQGQQFLPVKYKLFATLDLYTNYLGTFDIYVNNDSIPTLRFDYPGTYLDDPNWEYSTKKPGWQTYYEFELGEFTLEEVQSNIPVKFTLVKRHESGARGFGGAEKAQYLFIKHMRVVPVLND